MHFIEIYVPENLCLVLVQRFPTINGSGRGYAKVDQKKCQNS